MLPHAPAVVFPLLASIEASVRWQVGVLGVRRHRPWRSAAGQPDAGPRPAALLVDYSALGVRHPLAARVTASSPPAGGAPARFAYRLENAALALDVALGLAPVPRGTALTYRLCLTTPHDAASGAQGEPVFAPRVAAFRRQLARRAPRDLARLEGYVARRLRPTARPALAPPGGGVQDDGVAPPPCRSTRECPAP